MGVLEAIGLFWVVLGTGVFTAAVLIAAVWSITLGAKVIKRRYQLGLSLESSMPEVQEQRARR